MFHTSYAKEREERKGMLQCKLKHARREDQLKPLPLPLPRCRARVRLAVLMTFEVAVASVSLKIQAKPFLFEGSSFGVEWFRIQLLLARVSPFRLGE